MSDEIKDPLVHKVFKSYREESALADQLNKALESVWEELCNKEIHLSTATTEKMLNALGAYDKRCERMFSNLLKFLKSPDNE